MKTIIAVRNAGGKGKSETIKKFWTLLQSTYPCTILFPFDRGRDIGVVVKVNGKIIGIESCGDPQSALSERLSQLVNFKCDIIICASRTKGETVDIVASLKATYQIIWTSTYETDSGLAISRKTLNSLKARHILELLQSTGLIS